MTNHLATQLGRIVGKKQKQSQKRASCKSALERRPAWVRFRPWVEILEDRLAPAAPTILPKDPMSITSISALLGGNITNDGGHLIQRRGVVYSETISDPALLKIDANNPNIKQVEAPTYLPGPPSGWFMVTVGNAEPLKPNTTYYFRAFASNSASSQPIDPSQFDTTYSDNGITVASFKTNPGSAQENRVVMPADTVSTPLTPAERATYLAWLKFQADPVNNNKPNDNDLDSLWKKVNSVLFFQPFKNQEITYLSSILPIIDGQKAKIPEIPLKQITLTNNMDFTVYPFMRNAASTRDEGTLKTVFQGQYDPIDQMLEEYRGYVGYEQTINGVTQKYLGLLPGMSITINIPLVFWDGSRMEIATDATYLVNGLKVRANPNEPVPNPFQYFAFNDNGSATARVALPALSVSGPLGVTQGMVMWYREGLNTQGDPANPNRTIVPGEQATAPQGDAPSQLIEWTIRDPILSTLNPNIDKLHPFFGETHALINYDVSYVDNMALPVAMEALDVPVPVQITLTSPPFPAESSRDPRVPNPGPSLPYGWIGAGLSFPEFEAAVNNILTSGLGDYFTDAEGAHGWPKYNFPDDRFPGGTPLKIPAGQDVISHSPLLIQTSSYDSPISLHYQLTSGGLGATQVLGAGTGWAQNVTVDNITTTTLYLLANEYQSRENLKATLRKGMVVSGGNIPGVGSTVTVEKIGVNDSGFNFIDIPFNPSTPNPAPVPTLKVLPVTVKVVGTAIPDNTVGTPSGVAYAFNRPATDYATTAMIKLWYTWAKYYVDHLKDLEGYPMAEDTTAVGMPIPDPNPENAGNINNVIRILAANANPHLAPGMRVTGLGILPIRNTGTNPDFGGVTTIESIDLDELGNQRIHLSQKVNPAPEGSTYQFFLPTMSAGDSTIGFAMKGFDLANILPHFAPVSWDPLKTQAQQPNATPGVTNVVHFAQFAYQMLSLMSQVEGENQNAVTILQNVIGGNIAKPSLNGDANHNTERAFRDKIKSLLRGVNDFSVQNDQNLWYPTPADQKGWDGTTPPEQPKFNIYNLDPFVWLVHKQMGLSGYGFSLDDDAADISGNFATKLAVSIGGLNGLPNHFEWSNGSPYGPVSGKATILDATYPENSAFHLNEIARLLPYSFFSVQPYNANEKILGANLSGKDVPPNTTLLAYGNGGLYTYSYIPTNLHPPDKSNPLSGFTVGNSYQFTMLGPGKANEELTFVSDIAVKEAPYSNTITDVTIPFGKTLKITGATDLLTSYTQAYEQIARVSKVPTAELKPNNQHAPAKFVNTTFPGLDTIVNGTLQAARVEIVNGTLSGNGEIEGILLMFGPVAEYKNPIEMKDPYHNPPLIDKDWNNLANVIKGTTGGTLMPGQAGQIPGKLSVAKDVLMYGATFKVFAKGAGTPGTDYSQLFSHGHVSLGNSKLDLRLVGYTPQVGQSLTIIDTPNVLGPPLISGQFSQGNSITVNGFTFSITYNPRSVVLTCTAVPAALGPASLNQGVTASVGTATVATGPDQPGVVQALNAGQASKQQKGNASAAQVAPTPPEWQALPGSAVTGDQDPLTVVMQELATKPGPATGETFSIADISTAFVLNTSV